MILARQVRSYLEWSRVHIISSKLQKKGNSLKRQVDNKINFNRKIRFFICICSKSVSAINLERRFLSNSQIRLILRSQIKIPSKIVQWPKIQKDPKYVSSIIIKQVCKKRDSRADISENIFRRIKLSRYWRNTWFHDK